MYDVEDSIDKAEELKLILSDRHFQHVRPRPVIQPRTLPWRNRGKRFISSINYGAGEFVFVRLRQEAENCKSYACIYRNDMSREKTDALPCTHHYYIYLSYISLTVVSHFSNFQPKNWHLNMAMPAMQFCV